MILKQILKNKETILLHKSFLHKTLLIFTLLSLLFIKTYPNKIYTEQSLHEHIILDTYIFNQPENIKHIKDSILSIQTDPSYATILIKMKMKDFKQALTIYSTVISKNYFAKNMIIHFVDSKEFYLEHKKLFSKKVDLIYRKLFGNGYSFRNENQYFAVLDIVFSNKSNLIVDIFRNYRPNSDLLFVIEHFFDIELNFSPYHLIESSFDINRIKITIKRNIKDISTFIACLRCISNIQSHSLGSYFYFSFKNYHFNCVDFAPFISLNALILFLDNDKLYSLDIRAVLCIVFIKYPWVLIFMWDKLCTPFVLLWVGIVNPQIGFVISCLIYVKSVCKAIKNKN